MPLCAGPVAAGGIVDQRSLNRFRLFITGQSTKPAGTQKEQKPDGQQGYVLIIEPMALHADSIAAGQLTPPVTF